MNAMTVTQYDFFATTPKGLELLLVDELRALGVSQVAEKLAGVRFTGTIDVAYKACLWSRLANRILLYLTQGPAKTAEELYQSVQSIEWDQHMDPKATLAVHCVCVQSDMNHTLFVAQKVKDGIVDQLRDKYGIRPDVARDQPDVSVYVYLYRDQAKIYLDLSGESLHKRSYRQAGGSAPLKENLAAAILFRANWPAIAKTGGMLLDPMCGSGTLLIEAAMIASDEAPGLHRDYFGFLGWKQHQPSIWEALREAAINRQVAGRNQLPSIIGYDQDAHAIKIAFENIAEAGYLGKIHVERRELSALVSTDPDSGLVVVNPPYGERLGEVEELQPLYTEIGDKLKQHFQGWTAAVFTGNPELSKQMGLRAKKNYALFNGALACKLFLFDVLPEYFVDRSPEAENERRIRHAERKVLDSEKTAAQMFVNRLRKNMKHKLRRVDWIENEKLRVYDADIPEYAVIIDLTAEAAYVEEYPAPRSIDLQKVEQRRYAILAVLPEVLGLPAKQIFYSTFR